MKVTSLRKSYGSRVLFDSLSFEIEKGLLVIEGPSGCGKSTLLSLFEGGVRPDSGEVTFERGKDRISYCGTGATLFPEESLRKNLRLLLGIRSLSPAQERLVDRFSFRPLLDRKVFSLSGGERKKAELLLALFREADVYLFDECFAPLDERSRKALSSLLISLAKERLVVVVEHGKGASLPFDRKIIFQDGKVEMVEGSPASPSGELDLGFSVEGRPTHPALLLVRNAFRAKKASFLLLSLLLLLSFFFLLLSLVFSQTRSVSEREKTILEADVFPSVSVQVEEESRVLPSLPSSFVPSLPLSTEKGVSLFVATLSQDELWHYAPEDPLFEEEERFLLGETEYVVHRAERAEVDSVLPSSLEFSLIEDGGSSLRSLTLCSRSFLEGVLKEEESLVSDRGTSLLPEALFRLVDGRLQEGSGKAPVILEGEGLLSLPGVVEGTEVFLSDTAFSLLATAPICDDDIAMSLDVYVEYLSHLGGDGLRYTVEKDYFLEGDGDDAFRPVLFVQDYSGELSVSSLALLVVGLFFLLSFLLSLVLLRKSLSPWQRSVRGILRHAGIRTAPLLSEGLLSLALVLPPTLLVLLLSLTLFPWIANVLSVFLRYRYVPIPEGYYYYTLQPLCSYYDGIRSPLPLFQPGISELAVFVPAVIAFFALLVSFHYISIKAEK